MTAYEILDAEKAENGELEGYKSGEWTYNWDKLVRFPLEEIEVK